MNRDALDQRGQFGLSHDRLMSGTRRNLGAPWRGEHCWLGDLDSNQGCPGQSREFYR